MSVPLATAVTSPDEETVAIVVSDEAHVTVAPDMVVPPASFTVAVILIVSLHSENVCELGDSVTLDATCVMVTTAVPLAEPEVAVIVSVPFATAVTSPADETVAIVVSDDAHVTVAPEIAVPPASLTVAASVTVSPMDAKDFVLGDSATLDAVWVTVTTAVPLADPEVAVIVSVPLATAVTSPPDDTVAIDVLDDAQVTVAPDMVAPPASFTVALTVAVSPIVEKASEVGETSTIAAS